MSTDLPPENEGYVQQIVAEGLFPSRGEALDAAVELLRRREETRRAVQAGIDEIERGEVVPFDFEKMKADFRRRLAEQGGQAKKSDR